MPKGPAENATPEIVSSTIAELNQLGANTNRGKVVAVFNNIPPQERTVVNMAQIIDKLKENILKVIVLEWYPEETQGNKKIQERTARQFLRQKVMGNVSNFFARINGQAEAASQTGEIGVLTARDLKPVQETTLRGCLTLLNPRNWLKPSSSVAPDAAPAPDSEE